MSAATTNQSNQLENLYQERPFKIPEPISIPGEAEVEHYTQIAFDSLHTGNDLHSVLIERSSEHNPLFNRQTIHKKKFFQPAPKPPKPSSTELALAEPASPGFVYTPSYQGSPACTPEAMDELRIPTPNRSLSSTQTVNDDPVSPSGLIDPTFEQTMANYQKQLDAILKPIAPLSPMSSDSDEIEEPSS